MSSDEEEANGGEPADGADVLFDGDIGELSLEQRTALHRVLKHTYVSAEDHPDEWRTLTESELLLRSRLNDMFLDLFVDRRLGIAYKRQACQDANVRFPTLLRDTAYSREETILLLFLRARYRSERAAGADAVIVDRELLLREVAGFRPEHATNLSGDDKKAANAVDSLRRARLLIKTRDTDRLRIAPAIEVLLPLEKVQSLVEWLMTANSEVRPHVEDENEREGDDD